MQIYSVGGVVRRDVASIYREEQLSSPSCRHRVTYVPSRSAGRPPILLDQHLPPPLLGPLSLLAGTVPRRIISISHRPVAITTPSLVKGGPSPSPSLLNIFLLHHRISTRVLFQCSNGELWWPDTGSGPRSRERGV